MVRLGDVAVGMGRESTERDLDLRGPISTGHLSRALFGSGEIEHHYRLGRFRQSQGQLRIRRNPVADPCEGIDRSVQSPGPLFLRPLRLQPLDQIRDRHKAPAFGDVSRPVAQRIERRRRELRRQIRRQQGPRFQTAPPVGSTPQIPAEPVERLHDLVSNLLRNLDRPSEAGDVGHRRAPATSERKPSRLGPGVLTAIRGNGRRGTRPPVFGPRGR